MRELQKNYQMKRRRYGYGWIPTTWQSWLFLGLQLIIIFAAATSLPAKPAQPTADELVRFFVILGASIGTLLIFTTQTSPKPKWRWGKRPSDSPEEDF